MISYKNIVLGFHLPAMLLFSACALGDIGESTSKPSHITIAPRETVITPSAEEAASYRAESENIPQISPEDQQKGIEEGNIYVTYAHIMCFGGVLATPEEYEDFYVYTTEIPLDTPEEYRAKYNETPQEVKDQSALNDKMLFTLPQECLDAGWSNLN